MSRQLTLESIAELLAADLKSGRISLFLGSGISKAAPSFLPLWYEIRDGIVHSLSQGANVKISALELKNIAGLRPEIVLQILTDIFGVRALDCLNVLRNSTPNATHYFAAHSLRLGNSVITTNFDNLIEAACRVSAIPFRLFAYDHDMSSYVSQNSILKLHGTLLDEHGNDALETIITTIRQVGRGLSIPRSSALERAFATHSAIFIGYSGLDEFDIMPTIKNIGIKKCIWINHVGNKIPEIVSRHGKLDELDILLKTHFKNTIRIDGDTSLMVDRIYSKLNYNLPSRMEPFAAAPEFDHLRAHGRLAEAAGDTKAASRFYKKAQTLAESAEQEKVSQDDLAYIWGLQGQTTKALQAYKSLERLASNDIERARALFGQGKAHRVLGELVRATEALEKSADLFDRAGELTLSKRLTYDLAMTSLVQGNLDRAESLFAEGTKFFLDQGDMNESIWMATGRAGVFLLRGNFVAAQKVLEAAHQEYGSGIDAFPCAILSLSLAEVARLRDQHTQAKTHFQSASLDFSAISDVGGLVSVDLGMADLLRVSGKPKSALALIKKHIPVVRKNGRAILHAQLQLEIIEIRRMMGEAEANDYHPVRAQFTKIGMPSGELWAMMGAYTLTRNPEAMMKLKAEIEEYFVKYPALEYQKAVWHRLFQTGESTYPLTFV